MKTKITFLLLFALNMGIAQVFTDSNLPIVLINTDTNPATNMPFEIPDNPKVLATMKIIYRPDGTRNYLTDQNNATFLNYNGKIGIEKRGSSSQSLPKKPYGFTTLQANGTSNNNVSLLGMPSENDWILNSLAFDTSLIRDYLAYNLANEMGNYATRGKYCEVVLNGTYIGLYFLTEKIKLNSERVNVTKLTTFDNTLPNVSGGYLTKNDRDFSGTTIAWSYTNFLNVQVDFIHESPKPNEVTTQQTTFLSGVFSNLKNAVSAQNASTTNGFPSIIDIPTFVDFILVNEFTSNVDAYQFSSYYHKDRNGKLRAGPVWDFNLSMGLDVFGDRSKTNEWQFSNEDNLGVDYWNDMFFNPTFRCYVKRRFNELIAPNMPLNQTVVFAKIDAMTAQLAEARAREHEKWGTITNHAAHITAMKTWITNRLTFMDNFINSSPATCTFPTVPAIVISKIHYNPQISGTYTSPNLEFVELTNNSNATVNLSGFYFRELGFTYVFPNNSTIAPNTKIYLAGDTTTFTNFYGFAPFGVFTRNLSNKSHKLILADPFGNVVDFVEYQDAAPWPTSPDGTGPYLSLISLDLDNALASSWQASSVTLSLSDASLENLFVAYPNPTNGVLYIKNWDNQIKSVQVFDATGRLISDEKALDSDVEINLQNATSGYYLIQLHHENGKIIPKKIIKN